MPNLARFIIDGSGDPSPSTDLGYDATSGEALSLTLEAPGTAVVRNWRIDVYDAADASSPLASFDAPELSLVGATTGKSVLAANPAAAITCAMPVTAGRHVWIFRSKVNGGVDGNGNANADYVFERIVAIRVSSLRKIVPFELTQYSARGYIDAINEWLDSVAVGLSNTAATDVSSSAGTAGAGSEAAREGHTHRLTFAILNAVLGTSSASISVNSQKITNLATPTAGTDAANKAYVDSRSATADIRLEVNVPDDAIKTLYALDFAALPNQSVEFGAAGSDAFGFVDLIVNESGADDSGAGRECSQHVRRHVRRIGGGNVEFLGPPIVISEYNFGHTLTLADGSTGLLRITKFSDYDSTLSVRVVVELTTRTFADP